MFCYPISTLVNLTETREQRSRDTGEKANLSKQFLTGGWGLRHPKESEITRRAEQSLRALKSQKSGISSRWAAHEQGKTTVLEVLFFTRLIIESTGIACVRKNEVKMIYSVISRSAQVLLEAKQPAGPFFLPLQSSSKQYRKSENPDQCFSQQNQLIIPQQVLLQHTRAPKNPSEECAGHRSLCPGGFYCCCFVVFFLLQWRKRGKLSESQTKRQGTQKNWKFQC